MNFFYEWRIPLIALSVWTALPSRRQRSCSKGESATFLCGLSDTPEMTGGLFQILIYSDDDYFIGEMQI